MQQRRQRRIVIPPRDQRATNFSLSPRIPKIATHQSIHRRRKPPRRLTGRRHRIHHPVQRNVARLNRARSLRFLLPNRDAHRLHHFRQSPQRRNFVAPRHSRQHHSHIRSLPQSQLFQLFVNRRQSRVHRIHILRLLRRPQSFRHRRRSRPDPRINILVRNKFRPGASLASQNSFLLFRSQRRVRVAHRIHRIICPGCRHGV